MMNLKGSTLFFLAVTALGACATMPAGPSVRVWPAAGKPLEVFQSEDTVCRQWASQQVGTQANESANKTLATGAVVGTILGGGLGAAIGAANGHVGTGLAVGAASGAIVGTAAASGPASGAQFEVQRRYDNAYMECMYAKGNQVPGVVDPSRKAALPPPPPVAVQPQDPPITMNIEPPPVREEVIVSAPSSQHIWIRGHSRWNGRWVWQPGYWVIPPRPYAKWVPGHWRHRADGWVWISGQWRYR
jgi:uncharacterized protein YcfJ